MEDNSLSALPLDGSLQQALPDIRELNLNQNPLSSQAEVVASLQSLPRLISLYLSLYEEKAVHQVITGLPGLQYLNGIEIQRDEIFKQQQMQSQHHVQPEQLHHPMAKDVMPLPLEQIKETEEEENQSAFNPHGLATGSIHHPGTHQNPHESSQATTAGGNLESHFASVNKGSAIAQLNHSVIIQQSLPGSHSSFGMPMRPPSMNGAANTNEYQENTLNASLTGGDQAKPSEEANPYHHRKSL